jgi:hypothetical protein
MENELKNMVSGETYSRVNYGLEKYQKAKEAKEMMDKCTKVLGYIKKKGPSDRWSLTFDIGGFREFGLSNEMPFKNLTLETIKQFFTLLETLYYNEMKDAIQEFNNTLTRKIEEDGKAAEK